MSDLGQSGTRAWIEPPIAADNLPLRAVLTDDGASAFAFATEGTQDAAFVDVDGSGLYELLDLNNRLYMVSNGSGGITLATSGTPIAQLNDDGAGGYVISSDLTQTEAAVFYAAQDGSYYLALPNGGDGIQMLATGTTISFFI